MSHDCRLGKLEVFENQGLLFIRNMLPSMATPEYLNFSVEYCPICGEKGKRSHIEGFKMYPREDVDKLQHMHQVIMETFLNSCEMLVKENLKDHEFQFCMDTIHNTIQYVKSKRKKNDSSEK